MTTGRVEDHLPLTTVAFEILLAVGASARTGYEVMRAIEERTGGRLSPNPGTLYRAIDRLVAGGIIECRDEATDTGRERRTLRLSNFGTAVLRAETERLAGQVSAGVRVIGPAPRETP